MSALKSISHTYSQQRRGMGVCRGIAQYDGTQHSEVMASFYTEAHLQETRENKVKCEILFMKQPVTYTFFFFSLMTLCKQINDILLCLILAKSDHQSVGPTNLYIVVNINDAAVGDGEGCRRGNSEHDLSVHVKGVSTDRLPHNICQNSGHHPLVDPICGIEILFLLELHHWSCCST